MWIIRGVDFTGLLTAAVFRHHTRNHLTVILSFAISTSSHDTVVVVGQRYNWSKHN